MTEDRVEAALREAGIPVELAAHYRWVLDSAARYGWNSDHQLAEQARWMVKAARAIGDL